jgi:tetraacyldisaccharide 4'-kinase
MAEKLQQFWYSKSSLRYLLWPLHLMLVILVKIRKQLLGIIYQNRACSVPIVIIGNITVGGVGKTPSLIALAKYLQDKGKRVGIISRGYGAKTDQYPHKVTAKDNAEMVGDEPLMMVNNLDVPLYIDPDRFRAAQALSNNEKIDVILSDDGLQHYAMPRHIEVLLSDLNRGFGNGLLIPFGPLREPLSRAKEVDFHLKVAQSHYTCSPVNEHLIHIKPTSLIHIQSGRLYALEHFENQHVTALSAIADNEKFFNTLKQYCNVTQTIAFTDHYSFTERDLIDLKSDIVIMTEKDAVKCRKFAGKNWYYLKIEGQWDEEILEEILLKINLFNRNPESQS